MIIMLKLKMQKVFGYLKYQIPSPQKVFGKVFKCPRINMYLVFYLNTSFWVFDPTLHVFNWICIFWLMWTHGVDGDSYVCRPGIRLVTICSAVADAYLLEAVVFNHYMFPISALRSFFASRCNASFCYCHTCRQFVCDASVLWQNDWSWNHAVLTYR